jgi:hypothetical protein
MSEKVYPKGMRWQEPKESAPNFVKARVGINVEQFVEFLNEHVNERGWINFEMNEGREGGFYLVLDDFEPDPSKAKSKPVKETSPVDEEPAF